MKEVLLFYLVELVVWGEIGVGFVFEYIVSVM